MKRQTMVLTIKNMLDHLEDIYSNELKAEYLLYELEKLGIRPPVTVQITKSLVEEKIVNIESWEE